MRVQQLLAHPRLLASLPGWLIQLLGGWAGWWSYISADRDCKLARLNIYSSFPEMKRKEKERLLQQALRENAKTFLEMPRLWRQGKDAYPEHRVSHKGLEILNRAKDYGKGVILAVPYVGNWEIVVGFLSTLNTEVLISSTTPLAGLEEMAARARAATGATLVPPGEEEEETFLQALRAGALVCLFPDAFPLEGGEALSVPLFRGPVPTSTLLPRLARASGAVVVYSYAERIPGNSYRIQWILGPQEAYDPDPMIAAAAVNSGVRLCAKRHPGQYLWNNKRLSPRGESVASNQGKGAA